VVERHLAEYAAQLAEKEAKLQTVSSAAFDAKRAGDEAAQNMLMKTYARLFMDIAQIKRLVAQEEELKAHATRLLKSLKNSPRGPRERCPGVARPRRATGARFSAALQPPAPPSSATRV
jgi:hypothetical protein